MIQKKLYILFIYLSLTFSLIGNQTIESLQAHSMLYEAQRLAKIYSGKKIQWHSPYGKTRPQQVVETAPVWFTCYGPSTITCKDQSYF